MRERLAIYHESPSELKPQVAPRGFKEIRRYIDGSGSLHQDFKLRGKRRFTIDEMIRRHTK